jgi:amino acid permease
MTDSTTAEPTPALRGTLTTPKIVFLVIAAAAPMAAMVGIVPLAFVLGAGAATPAIFAVCGLVLLCFSVGYAAMSRRITSAGGFYPYVARGLGRPPAVAAALVAVIAYNAVAVELVAGLGYFGQLVVQQQTGVNLPWELYAAFGVAAAAVLGYRTIDVGARLLAVLIVAEIGILLVLDIAVLAAKGGAALPATSFAPHTFLHSGGSVGIGLMFAFGAYVGFESAALYGEESQNPRRSVPLATYASVVVITVFYGLTSWVAVGAVGAGQVRAVASKELGNMFFALSTQYVTPWVTTVMEVLLCTQHPGLAGRHPQRGQPVHVRPRPRADPARLAGRLAPPPRLAVPGQRRADRGQRSRRRGLRAGRAESLPEPGHGHGRARHAGDHRPPGGRRRGGRRVLPPPRRDALVEDHAGPRPSASPGSPWPPSCC